LTNDEHKQLASQLRKPQGEKGIEVADFMNKGNVLLNRNAILQIKPKINLQVMELGMGNGRFVEELFEMFPNMTYSGCDYSADMVKAALKNNQARVDQNQAFFYTCDASQLPFPSNILDVIFTVNTLYFWEDVPVILQEFKRTLRSGGQVIIGIRPKHLMKDYPFTKFGFNLFDETEVIHAMEAQGFREVRAITVKEPDFVTAELQIPVESLIVVGLV
jgi:ubiquinone/menaquinone biosynthesis C-methylase UbiE